MWGDNTNGLSSTGRLRPSEHVVKTKLAFHGLISPLVNFHNNWMMISIVLDVKIRRWGCVVYRSYYKYVCYYAMSHDHQGQSDSDSA